MDTGRSRRRFLAALGGTAATGGCLRLEGTRETGTRTRRRDDSTETTGDGTDATGTASPTASGAPSSVRGDWSQFQADAANTGAGEVRAAPTAGEPLWTTETDGQGNDAPVALHDGTLYFGDWDNALYAVDGLTGDLQWRRSLPGNVAMLAPAADGDLLVVPAGGRLFGVAPDDGRFLWEADLGAETLGSPAIAGETVYQAAWDGRLYALARNNGAVRWRYDTGGPGLWSGPAVADGTVYVGSLTLTDDAHADFGAFLGEDVWPFDRDGLSTLKAREGRSGSVHAVAAADGSREWRADLPDWVLVSSPTVADGRVFVGCFDGHLYALRAADGSRDWSVATDDVVYSSPAIAGDTVFFTSVDRSLYAVAAADGSRRWFYPLGSDNQGNVVSCSPTVGREAVYVGADDPAELYALDRESGRVQWSHRTGGVTVTSPALAEGLVFLADGGGDPRRTRVRAYVPSE